MTDPDIPELIALFRAAAVGGEREVLAAILDFQREAVKRKVVGLSEVEARRRFVPSQTTLAGLLKHLAVVEDNWFGRVLEQRATEPPYADATFQPSGAETVERLVAAYDDACAESRRIAAGFDLDHSVPQEELGRVSLRWIYAHMIEETARHAGHADILRELTDGVTGVWGGGPRTAEARG